LQVKVKEYYKTDRLDNALPIPDALDGVKKLKEMGFKLVVITARSSEERERSLIWIDRHFPGRPPPSRDQFFVMHRPSGIFETVICTGQSQEVIFEEGHELLTKLSKADVRISNQRKKMSCLNRVLFRSVGKSTRRS
jgi:hypothetical protein